MGKYQELARKIVENVGGKENINGLTLYHKASFQIKKRRKSK